MAEDSEKLTAAWQKALASLREGHDYALADFKAAEMAEALRAQKTLMEAIEGIWLLTVCVALRDLQPPGLSARIIKNSPTELRTQGVVTGIEPGTILLVIERDNNAPAVRGQIAKFAEFKMDVEPIMRWIRSSKIELELRPMLPAILRVGDNEFMVASGTAVTEANFDKIMPIIMQDFMMQLGLMAPAQAPAIAERISAEVEGLSESIGPGALSQEPPPNPVSQYLLSLDGM